jgi:hypothetical protein
MKTKHFLFTFALLIAVTLISCKKDKSDSNNNNNGGTGGNAQVVIPLMAEASRIN